jgi:hypothetical protein
MNIHAVTNKHIDKLEKYFTVRRSFLPFVLEVGGRILRSVHGSSFIFLSLFFSVYLLVMVSFSRSWVPFNSVKFLSFFPILNLFLSFRFHLFESLIRLAVLTLMNITVTIPWGTRIFQDVPFNSVKFISFFQISFIWEFDKACSSYTDEYYSYHPLGYKNLSGCYAM